MGWIQTKNKPASLPLLYSLGRQKTQRIRRSENTDGISGNTIPWIEKPLQTPIEDYRKNVISLILAPVKHFEIMMIVAHTKLAEICT